MDGLYHKYRPTKFKQLVEQDAAVKMLNGFKGKYPHAMLLTGPSGCGKTTIARILQTKMGVDRRDFEEKNCADFNGVEMARGIRKRLFTLPFAGPRRIWYIDECHELTKDAQNALLKMLEDPPPHAYFVLSTTHPNKLLPTVVTRCTEIRVQAVSQKGLVALVQSVLAREGAKVPTAVTERIAEVAEGSCRKALVLAEQVMGLDNEQDMLAALLKSDSKQQAIDICRAIMFDRDWGKVSKLIKGCDEEPEMIRRLMLSYASTICLSGDKKKAARAYVILDCFVDNFYDSGKPGLVRAAYEACAS